jgi:tRNA pseudouridine55 synthase
MDGVLIIDKPAGMTSHDVVARVRKLTGHRRVGHTGTLDPFATGVLVILIGRATRLAQFLSGAEKEYEAVVRLGFATDTGDLTGVAIEAAHAKAQRPRSFRKDEIEVAINSLRGELKQTPPMYSAKKIAGQKLYELARRGEQVERRPVSVVVSEFEAVERTGTLLAETSDGNLDLGVRVVCSAGTYIRTLAEDLGKELGIGAHVAELRRTRAGQFSIAEAITLDQLQETVKAGSFEQLLISPDAALSFLPVVQLDSAAVRRVAQGIDQPAEETVCWPNGQPVRMRAVEGALMAVGIYDREKNIVHPQVVIGTS